MESKQEYMRSEKQINKPATPEQIHEYQVLKARNEWIKMNQKRLDEIENHKLLHVRVLLVVSILNLIVSLIYFYLSL